ncbi:MAG: hypothetical protein A2Y16_01750 [Tenericutes bacterium GWF2_57_13]|nr:MAG: hypothetical protein A2Y16_01750 [Tenericutes bacterium GWF2_57_13]
MSEFDLFTKDSFFLIGYDGAGSVESAPEWIPPLWDEFKTDFAKIEKLAVRPAHGAIPVWGAMTDLGQEFQPWGEEGKYMAGVESDRYLDALGFAVWRIPGFIYVRAAATLETYALVYRRILGTVFPENGWDLVGAVQEYYLKDRMWLLFPIKRL